MATISDVLARLRGLDLEKALGLRPPYPPVAVEMDRGDAVLVRLRPRRRGKPLLESHQVRALAADGFPQSIFQTPSISVEALAGRLSELFESSGTRPGRVSLLLPDNLAKVTLLELPERPSSSRHLDELVLSKMRRAVPFRIEDARVSYQVFPGERKGVAVLVVLARRTMLDRFEEAFRAVGARAGMIDICTPNLINLYREPLGEACGSGGDAALLNCARDYFSLVILRDQRLIFFRCKTFSFQEDRSPVGPNGVLVREVANSFSYYREKLAGEGVAKVFVRSIAAPIDEIADKLRSIGIGSVERVDPGAVVDAAGPLDFELGQRLAPALGAAAGRGN